MINFKGKIVLKNFSYTLASNLLSTLISTVVILLVPKFIGALDYGFIQLYLFYASYTSYLSLGITDGAYIRYGGMNFEEINKSYIRTQFLVLKIITIIFAFVIVVCGSIWVKDCSKIEILFWACISGILVVPRSLITLIFLSTNRMKEYSCIIVFEKLTYISIVILLLVVNIQNFRLYIVADLIGKFISCIYMYYISRNVLIGKYFTGFKNGIFETIKNLKVGIKIVGAGLASMLILGIVRFGISNKWSIEVFGKVSLTLSISNMLITFINAVSLVLFPMLCKKGKERLAEDYNMMETVVSTIMLCFLILYYPLRVILITILPQYEMSLSYMALIFPICLFESKMQLIVNTYFKALRKEKYILSTNLITVLLSLVLTTINVFILHNLTLTVFSLMIILAFRAFLSELLLGKELNIKNLQTIFVQLVLTLMFVLFNWKIQGVTGWILYIVAFITYCLMKRKRIFNSIKQAKYYFLS